MPTGGLADQVLAQSFPFALVARSSPPMLIYSRIVSLTRGPFPYTAADVARPMLLLIISLVLAFLPWLGIAWIVLRGSITTVDGLFMGLILLTMSGIFALSATIEFPRARRARAIRAARGPAQASFQSGANLSGAAISGLVQSVQFFEAHVGRPNKSVITLRNGQGNSRILVLEGDLRNRLPAGKRVQLLVRDENGSRTLVAAETS